MSDCIIRLSSVVNPFDVFAIMYIDALIHLGSAKGRKTCCTYWEISIQPYYNVLYVHVLYIYFAVVH